MYVLSGLAVFEGPQAPHTDPRIGLAAGSPPPSCPVLHNGSEQMG